MMKRWLILFCLILAFLPACTPTYEIKNQDIVDMLDEIVQYDDVKRTKAESLGPDIMIYIYLKDNYTAQSVNDIMQVIMDSITLEVIEALKKEIKLKSVPNTLVSFMLKGDTVFRYNGSLKDKSSEQYTWTQEIPMAIE